MRILEIREYKGRNIYSHYPVIKGTIDLEELADVWSDQVGDFVGRLCRLIPGMQSHYCSRGREGGFVERLKEGTLFGHVVEHIALELQSMAGQKVTYGKTMSTNQPGVYEVIVEAELMEMGKEALREAVEIVKVLIQGGDYEVAKTLNTLKDLEARFGYGPSTAAIIQECRVRGIPILPLGWGSYLQLGYGINQKRIQATVTGDTSCIGVDIAGNKELTKMLLSKGGIPVPRGLLARTPERAVEISEEIGRPVVLKPCNGNHGKGVYLNLCTPEKIHTAFRLAQEYDQDVIVEKYITGKQYRLLVIGDQMVAAAQRTPAYVTGDGTHSVVELVELTNKDPLRGEDHEKPLTRIRIDANALFVLAKQKLNPYSVPPRDEIVYLRENANLSTGGTAIDVTDEVPRGTKRLAVRVARIVGLDVAGIDLVIPDISLPMERGGAIIEVNAAPGLRMHLHPAAGQARNVADHYVRHLFPGKNGGRIPIISITGTNGKTTVTRLTGYIMDLWGKAAGVAATGGVYVGDEILIKGDTTGPQSAQIVLGDPRVEVAVLETARGGILRSGLGYAQARVGVITNISEDHLGTGGIEDMGQLARTKALVVEALENNGTAILNADDPWSGEISKHIRQQLVYFSLAEDNLIVKHHLATGQKAFFLKKECLVYAAGSKQQRILPQSEIPFCINGLATFNIANALAAAAASHSVGVPLAIIREALRTFGLKKEHNPGRCQIYEFAGIRVILDYGHNAEAYRHILGLARRLKPRRLLGVIGVPGDRRDQDIRCVGNVAGKYLDYCIVKEDQDLRGRVSGETAALLLEGLRQNPDFGQQKGEVILNEIIAVYTALSRCVAGDTLVIFYENLIPLQSILENLERQNNLMVGEEPETWPRTVEKKSAL